MNRKADREVERKPHHDNAVDEVRAEGPQVEKDNIPIKTGAEAKGRNEGDG